MPLRDIVGHRQIVRLLARAASRQSLPPSLIFAGPEGVGKRLSAIALAQVLNCAAPVAFETGVDACGECTACRRIARGVHSDVLAVAPEDSGSIGIDQVREALERTQYRPFEGRRRVVIVDPADRLIEAAQQALLKTLEEPPPGSVFVLITSRPDALLATVRSRCPRLRFGPLSPAEAAMVLQAESGELADAREAAQQALEALAGAEDPRRRLEAAKLLAGSGGGSPRMDREETARRLRAMASLVRDLGVLTTRADERLLANADLQRELGALARAYGRDRVLRAFSAVDRALWALTRNASPKVVADWLALQV